ncbi:hypothetical protein BGW41_004740 [Actinomortierella wolfii]|nr:hypothetical protein BGW41_004740 [Actinomortierella wolfii]
MASSSLVDQLFLTSNDVARIQSLFHHSQRFRHLDLLSIGEDHVFVVHRALLMQDIQDYLSGSNKYLLRVFVNVDHRLSKPAMIPGNRCYPLEDYVANVLRPEMELRIQTWDDAERCRSPLPVPRDVSLVTLTGWMLTYPIIYVIPKSGRRNIKNMYNHSAIDDDDQHSDETDDEGEGDDDDDDLQGRNCLANHPLVVTRITLEPNCDITGLREHAFMSFSFPADLDPSPNVTCDDGCHGDKTTRSELPPARLSLQQPLHNSDSRHPSRTNSTSTQASIRSSISSSSSVDSVSSPLTITPADCERFYPDDDDIESAVLSPRSPDDITVATKHLKIANTAAMASTEEALPLCGNPQASPTMDRTNHQLELQGAGHAEVDKEEEEQEVCVFAAGRSFLHQLHVRFQQQKIWSTWQVGQETVTLPVVAM